MSRKTKTLAALSVLLVAGWAARAQTSAKPQTALTPLEQRASLNLAAARSNPLQLRNLLLKMPKGSDLHNHLYGAVNAETWIKDAAEDGMCIDPAAIHGTSEVYSSGSSQPPACPNGKIPAADVYKNQHLYDDLINAFSMRNFVPAPGVSGHDHFFNTFARFNGISEEKHLGEWIHEIAAGAGRANVQYIELMHTPPFARTAAAAYEVGWQDDLAHFRDALLAKGVVRADVATAKQQLDASDADRAKRDRCDQPGASPACKVEVRYLCQVLRGFPKQQVFGHLILCFETASADPRFVGINMVMPEDGYYSMSEYADQMRMVEFLHRTYPKVHISLHAGEIAPPLVTYDAICCHIRLAVEQAGAERIGHGIDVMWEQRPHELLQEMAAKHVMVEINLTSNDMILGVSGKNHPLPLYRQFGVPVSLSTDDEGVSRSDMTQEYVRAVQTYDLKYMDLKQMVRTGLAHIFLPGPGLWAAPDKFTLPVPACAQDRLGSEMPAASCSAFLKSSEKARQQWQLEHRFHEFESGL
jgi:adenosine deaminase